ncbi:DUF368 domain-containing protein [uncultured Pseudokineococcus sp.]|uniref:DUF368 domain-containing protein n=1 Tax=uncultured Pseudokineococcus sp. TaxID=1642928 RepID=UPI002625F23D|nr:DUF368 domain-containing protein [uncultured Pseudokineococcus sp.]
MTTQDQRSRTPVSHVPLHVGRGMLMGAAEVVPGVSGGTIALITGVYETLIDTAGHTVTAFRRLVTGDVRGARAELAQGTWLVVVPLLLGTVVAVVVGASLIEPLLEDHPVGSRAVFAGLVLASLSVPAMMVGRAWTTRLVVVAVVAAVLAFVLTGLPPGSAADPPLPVVSLAAAVAICALVLPGVSGSFLLATVGLYEPTIAAVNGRDLGYLGAFALGAVIGLALFVRLLQHLLSTHRAVTLAVMTGLMAGSLRALWPWQTEDRDVLAPSGDVLAILGLALAGAAVVVALLVVERLVGGADPASSTADEPPAAR